MELFCVLFCFFCCKIHKKKPVLESLFNQVAGQYPATSLKERTPAQVFSDEFARYLRQNTSRRLLLFYEKHFTNKIVKNSLRKNKKMETVCKKNNDTHRTKTWSQIIPHLHMLDLRIFRVEFENTIAIFDICDLELSCRKVCCKNKNGGKKLHEKNKNV